MSLLLAAGGGGGPSPITGNLSATLDSVSVSATAAAAIIATLAASLADVSVSSDADVAIVGSLSVTVADATITSDADLPIVGAMTSAVDDVSLSGAAALPIIGTLSLSIDDVLLSGSASASLSGSLSGVTLDDITLSSSAIIVLASAKVRAHLLSPWWNTPWIDGNDLLFAHSVGFLKQIVDVINGTEQDTGGYAVDLGYLRINVGTGAPNGVVLGSPPDIYLNRAGGAGTTVYVKESGSSTTAGWVGV